MKAVKAYYDGHSIKPLEPVSVKGHMEVIIVFPENGGTIAVSEARKRLRGSGKGEKLTELLLQSRKKDLVFEEKT
jgi:hypothetical protein